MPLGWIMIHAVTHTAIFFLSIFISRVLVLHHEINDLPVDWSEAVFLFCFFKVVHMFVTVCLDSCAHGWVSVNVCMGMCKCSFTYAFGCLCLCVCVRFYANESLCSKHHGGLRIPELFLPFLTQGARYKLLTLHTYLLISLLSISFSLSLCPHANT